MQGVVHGLCALLVELRSGAAQDVGKEHYKEEADQKDCRRGLGVEGLAPLQLGQIGQRSGVVTIGCLVHQTFDGLKARIDFVVVDLQDQTRITAVSGVEHPVDGLTVGAVGFGHLVCNALVLDGSVVAHEFHRRPHVLRSPVEPTPHFGARFQPVLALQRFFGRDGGCRGRVVVRQGARCDGAFGDLACRHCGPHGKGADADQDREQACRRGLCQRAACPDRLGSHVDPALNGANACA
jgi:hypothetical protein